MLLYISIPVVLALAYFFAFLLLKKTVMENNQSSIAIFTRLNTVASFICIIIIFLLLLVLFGKSDGLNSSLRPEFCQFFSMIVPLSFKETLGFSIGFLFFMFVKCIVSLLFVRMCEKIRNYKALKAVFKNYKICVSLAVFALLMLFLIVLICAKS